MLFFVQLYFINQCTEGRFYVDVVGCPGSTHECVRLGLSYIIHFSSSITIFHKNFLLRCLANNEMHMLSRGQCCFRRVHMVPIFRTYKFSPSHEIVSKLLLDQLPNVTPVPFIFIQ
uniref:Secreted protein n=1 Tax=Heterorhabditis bacteriophora TaxID=37862 RepID=A0A1I7W877_HETBA